MHSERSEEGHSETVEEPRVSDVVIEVNDARMFKTPFRVTVEAVQNTLGLYGQRATPDFAEELVRLMVTLYFAELATRGYKLYSTEELKNCFTLRL